MLLVVLMMLMNISYILSFPLAARTANSIISENRQANFEYEFTEKIEAGIMMVGTEVKSCRHLSVQISDGIAEIRDGEAWLMNVHIDEWNRSSMRDNHKPKRTRKILLNKSEILKLEQRMLQRNQELIPLKVP